MYLRKRRIVFGCQYFAYPLYIWMLTTGLPDGSRTMVEDEQPVAAWAVDD
jgi:hypothetical protein